MDNWGIPGSPVGIYHNLYIPAMIGAWAPHVLALEQPRAGEAVLDVACGTGLLTRLLAEAVGAGGTVAGVDINAKMLAYARLVLLRARIRNPH